MIHIKTDSCVDLSRELIDQFDLQILPLHVMVNGKDHLDNELTLQTLFSSVEQSGLLPKTAAPTIKEFMDFFNEEGPVIYIGISSELSATMQNARLAADQLGKEDVYLVDSLNLSTGIGLLALKAADLRRKGYTAPEIIERINACRNRVETSFVIDTMDYLYKGGRCTGIQAFVGSVLQIRPIIAVREDGTLGVRHKVRGSRKKALDTMLYDLLQTIPQIDTTRVFVTHTACPEDADYLVQQIKQPTTFKDIHITLAGATIASHCGPNTIGILYLQSEEED
jgi:DegV family protein with EDD domain